MAAITKNVFSHCHRYPHLSVLAKQYLCMPATSVPAERVFLTAGHVFNRLRTRLSPEHVDMLIFLQKNFYKTEIRYPSEEGDDD